MLSNVLLVGPVFRGKLDSSRTSSRMGARWNSGGWPIVARVVGHVGPAVLRSAEVDALVAEVDAGALLEHSQ